MRGRPGVLSPRGAAHGGLADLAEPSAAMADQRLARHRRRRRALRHVRSVAGWLCAGLLAATLGGSLAAGASWVLTAPRFAVEGVEVAGQSRLSPDEVIAASGLTAGQNLFRIDARRVVAGVEALPQVRRAEMVRVFPNRVRLAVEERRPFTLVNAGALYWVDEQGLPLGPAPRAVALDAPVISGLGADDLAGSGRTPSERMAVGVALIRALMRAQNSLLREISEVDVSRPGGPVLYMLDGVEVRLGGEDWDGQLGRLGGVLAQLHASGQTATSIDLRFRDQVVLRTAAK